jgi:hypothetical protein
MLKYSPKKDERGFKIKEEYGMQMDMSRIPKEGMTMDHSKMEGMEKTT